MSVPALPRLDLGRRLGLCARLTPTRPVLHDPVPEMFSEERVDDGRAVLAGHRGVDSQPTRRLQGDIGSDLHLAFGLLCLWGFVPSSPTRLGFRPLPFARLHRSTPARFDSLGDLTRDVL